MSTIKVSTDELFGMILLWVGERKGQREDKVSRHDADDQEEVLPGGKGGKHE